MRVGLVRQFIYCPTCKHATDWDVAHNRRICNCCGKNERLTFTRSNWQRHVAIGTTVALWIVIYRIFFR